MPYTTVLKVNNWLAPEAKVNDQVGYPSSAIVTERIGQVTSELNVALLVGGVTLPIVDPDWLTNLEGLATGEVVWWTEAVRARARSDKTVSLYDSFHKTYQDALKLFREGKAAAVLGSTDASMPWSYTRDADASDPTDDRNPIFTKDYVP